jgi:hypothetical protein
MFMWPIEWGHVIRWKLERQVEQFSLREQQLAGR